MFIRAQTSALIATATDFAIMAFCYQILNFPLWISVGIGPLAGGLLNFFLNRHWSFKTANSHVFGQLIRYTLVCLISAVANIFGVLLILQNAPINYLYARVLAAIVVALFVNYPLHRNVVFSANRV